MDSHSSNFVYNQCGSLSLRKSKSSGHAWTGCRGLLPCCRQGSTLPSGQRADFLVQLTERGGRIFHSIGIHLYCGSGLALESGSDIIFYELNNKRSIFFCGSDSGSTAPAPIIVHKEKENSG